MVALLSSSGQQRGQMRLPAYGAPFGLPPASPGDDADGDVDAADQSLLFSLCNGVTLVRAKLAPEHRHAERWVS